LERRSCVAADVVVADTAAADVVAARGPEPVAGMGGVVGMTS
jgi:hypothetical protein